MLVGMRSGVMLPALNLDFASGRLDSRITFSRPSLATYFDSTGKLTYAPNNLLVNTATLSTQTVNTNIVAGFDVILSFTGTGSVAISGGHTATLAGTGATNRVFLKFTPTTTSLTFTVTGTVTEAMLERVTYQTTPSTYVANTVSPSSQYFGPRFEYDPVTLVPRGLLIEEARTNIVRYSEQFNDAYWVPGSATVAANSVTSPSGTTTADTVTSSTGSFAATIASSGISVSASTAYTYSIFLKANVGTNVRLRLSDTVTGQAQVTINLVTGAISGLAAGPYSSVSASSVNCGNGWWRAILTGTQPAGQTNAIVGLYLENNGDAVYAWGAQLEAGAFATSYLPTGASTAARSADDVSMTGTNFSSWFSATQGAFVFRADTASINNAAVYGVGSTATNIMRAFRQTDFQPVFQVVESGAAQATIGLGAANWPQTSVVNMSTAYATNNFAAAVNGNAAVTDTLGNVPTVTQMTLGFAPGLAYLNGHIASIQFYTSRLSNDQLQALTQPSLEASMFLTFDTSSDSFVDASWGP